MRKSFWMTILSIFTVTFILVGCGTPSSKEVLTQLKSAQASIVSYKSTAELSVKLQNIVQTYYVETWYKNSDTYRIAIGSSPQDISQIVLRNSTGLYIVSPHLKKTFRFRGEWADGQGHMYLYHSVVDRVLSASKPEVKVSSEQNEVTLTVPVSKSHPLLSQQSITLQLGNMTPKRVVLYDKQHQGIVTLDYRTFKRNVRFADADFSASTATEAAPGHATPVSNAPASTPVVLPQYIPSGTTLQESVDFQGGHLLRFSGQESFAIDETAGGPKTLYLGTGEMVDLGGIPGVVVGSKVKTLYWMGRDDAFSLTGAVPLAELTRVAVSMIPSPSL